MRAFFSTWDWERGGRVLDLPVGSPIMAVKSPMRKMTVWPMSWRRRSLFRMTMWPRWRSGAEGSAPHFIVSFFLPERSFLVFSSGIISWIPVRNLASRSDIILLLVDICWFC